MRFLSQIRPSSKPNKSSELPVVIERHDPSMTAGGAKIYEYR